MVTRLLAAARLCSRLISQDQVLPSTKLLKLTLALSYLKLGYGTKLNMVDGVGVDLQ
jgi:hypothetical protein